MSFFKKLIPGHNKDKDASTSSSSSSSSLSSTSSSSFSSSTTTSEGGIAVTSTAPGVAIATTTSDSQAHTYNNRNNFHESGTAIATATGTNEFATTATAPVAFSGTATTMHGTTEEKMLLSEEKLLIGKSEQQVGGVDIEKRIERTQAQVPVTLEKDVVTIERRPIAAGTIHDAEAMRLGFGKEQAIVASVHAEQAVAAKVIVPSEQVIVTKDRVLENQLVQGTVRSETAEVKHDVRDIDAIRFQEQQAVAAAGATAGTAGTTGTSAPLMDANGRVVAFKEEMAVGKERVSAGQVEVQKRVESSLASQNVTLGHDEIGVQRTALTGGVAIPTSLSEGIARVGISRETAVVGTVVVPKEEIVIRKAQTAEQHIVTGELAQERIAVTSEGNVHLSKDELLERERLARQQPGYAAGTQATF